WSMPHEKPYVLLNFYGSIRDITTIAHEFGHAIHMTLSLKNKYLVSNPALNISETASTFGEKLTHEYLLTHESDPKKKIELICARLDDVMATVFRQTAFLKFERKIHEIRKDKELSAGELNTEWRKVLEESLGDGVEIDHCIDNYWGYITHFTSSPFYVYSYSFGALFVEGLYAEYKKQGKDFVTKYEEALASGGTKNYAEIAQMFGIDANSKEFWESALKSIETEIDELETLCDSTIRN
ncbi:MAG: oligoendopeptidase F, partial [Alphaproteobacteria bacterium]|nr:oligoendopeptidase F [Alphaproteobacteria bacterium]